MKLSRSIVCVAVWSLLVAGPALAAGDVINDVKIEGNQRIEGRTILSYLNLAAGSTFNQTEIDSSLKNLYATGFFADVQLMRSGGTLIVKVVENPIINQVAFEGNDRIETKDLEKEVELKGREIYSREKVQSDVKRILDIYRKSGRYSATVEPKVIRLDQNRVDLVYEIAEGATAKVEKITFIGNNEFSADSLREAIRTEESRWYKFFTDSDKYDADRLQFDQEMLRRFYISEGYADFQVKSAHAELSPAKDAFYVTFVIDEGVRYDFGAVEVVSELKDQEKPDFSGIIQTQSGKTYDASKVEATVEAMTNELGNLGYAFVDIQPKLDRDREKKLANITYIIKPGPRVYVERINITGNVRTLDEVVRREFRLSEGDPYNSSKLERTEQRLNNLGFFEKVEVKNEPGSASDKTVVNVDVKEKSTGEVNVGAGYSTSDGVLGEFGVRENNFLGSGQELKARLTYAARRRQYELGFTEPYFLGRELATGFDLYRTERDFQRESSYDMAIRGINLRTNYSLQEHLQHGFTYSLRQTDVTDIEPTASTFIRQQEGKNTNSSIGQAFTYDDRDNKFNPTRGTTIRVMQEFAGLGGDSRYLKHDLKGAYFHSLYPKWVASVSGTGGYIFGLGGRDVRINDRFFVGGDDLRGFRTAGIGPRDVASDDALGGNAYYTGSAELKFPLGLPEEVGLSGAVFGDVGSLWKVDDNGAGIFDDSALRTSAGVGVLWTSPFGPIRVDFARAISKQDEDQTETFRFSFGTRF
ncbi:MAG: outer membrane protein assembly factor BamA [Rickettsiales bacterium]|jgi:outer membrane protein insertion porin family|nr:outer membrane protein assembly factor BamA [Rickettsiales bacterium]